DLVEVDVVGAQPSERGVDLLQNRHAGQALTTRPVVHPAEHLRGQDDVLATGVARDRTADELLRRAVLVAVRRVHKVMPSSTACRKNGWASSSFSAQVCAPGYRGRRNSCTPVLGG